MTSLKRIAVSVFCGAFFAASAELRAQMKEGTFTLEAEPVVKGLPYSGEGLTTVKLTMFDGTKMERTVTAKLYRDSAGRLRREQAVVGLEALDPNRDFRAIVREALDPNSDFRTIVHIVDPVADVFYTLNPATRTADRLPLSMLKGGVKPLSVPLEYAKEE